MIVVADTAVLLNLAFLSLDGLLADLFGEVLVPDAVAGELLKTPPFTTIASSLPDSHLDASRSP